MNTSQLMEMDELLAFVEEEDKRLSAHYGKSQEIDEVKRWLGRSVKLTEEVGELCGAVLSHASLQRTKKLDAWKPENLSEEFADVIITALLLAKSMNIDIKDAFRKKVEKIKKRNY